MWRPILLLLLLFVAQSAGAQGRVLRIASKVLGEERVVHVGLPLQYAIAKQRYPVIFLLDGQARPFFDVTVATAGYDLVGGVRDFAMPPQIVVAIEQIDRRKDLATNDSAFMRFLADELVPYIDREFRTLPFRTLIGHSLGGRFALMAMCRAPAVFPAIVAISPGIADTATYAATQQCARSQFASRSPVVRTVVLSAGSGETRLRAASERLATFLRDSAPDTWQVSHLADAGVSHTDAPLRSIPAALQFVFGASLWELSPAMADSIANGLGDPDATLERGLAAVSARLGFRVVPSLKWRGARASHVLANGTIEQALAAARTLIAEYPEQLQGYMNLADAHIRARDYPAARSALNDGLSLLKRRSGFDEAQRASLERVLREALAGLPR